VRSLAVDLRLAGVLAASEPIKAATVGKKNPAEAGFLSKRVSAKA
jgi:hypothetical protein